MQKLNITAIFYEHSSWISLFDEPLQQTKSPTFNFCLSRAHLNYSWDKNELAYDRPRKTYVFCNDRHQRAACPRAGGGDLLASREPPADLSTEGPGAASLLSLPAAVQPPPRGGRAQVWRQAASGARRGSSAQRPRAAPGSLLAPPAPQPVPALWGLLAYVLTGKLGLLTCLVRASRQRWGETRGWQYRRATR